MTKLKVQEIQETPNPNALKFITSSTLTSNGVVQFDDAAAAQKDPLAKSLFAISGIQAVFYSGQFVTLTKTDRAKWDKLKQDVINAIEKVEPTQLSKPTAAPSGAAFLEGDELYERINKVIDENVKPPLEADGGGLEIIGLDGFVLTVRYQGACGGCPSSSQGTLMAIQNLLRAMVDPRIQVISA